MRATWRAPGQTGAHGRPRRRPWRNVGLAQGVQRDAQRLQRKNGCCLPVAAANRARACCDPAEAGA